LPPVLASLHATCSDHACALQSRMQMNSDNNFFIEGSMRRGNLTTTSDADGGGLLVCPAQALSMMFMLFWMLILDSSPE